ncbi:MAG: MMPL family transporter [Acidimicrobiia bacterium]|nr:MMPL family transporter [Acidimicrobiia bacterium]
MKKLVSLLAAMVERVPVLVLVGALTLTVVFGGFVSQQEQASGNEGFSPDSEEFLAGELIADKFDTSTVAPVQVVFGADGDDVLTADGLRSYLGVVEAIEGSRAVELFSGLPGGDIQGFLGPATAALAAQGVDPTTATDAEVKSAFTTSLDQLGDEQRGQIVSSLSATDTDLGAARSSAGLLVVLLNTGLLDDDPDGTELQAIQVDMSDAIDASIDGDVSASAFSFALLFADTDEFQREIGRLFGTAFAIILAILGFVFWIHPKGRMTRRAALRRASADVLLALAVIVMSITWMNGIGVLLGPKYLGVIGKFSEILQIIPILLIGLGVDYAIHLTARYREELGSGQTVDASATRATRTVGVALVLATVTTAVGFLTNIFNPVTALADFGILAAVGIGSAFVLMLTFVPAVRVLLDRRAQRRGVLPVEAMGHSSERMLPRLLGRSAVFAERVPAAMLTLALGLGGLGLWGMLNLSTTFSFTDFLPEDAPLLETFDTLTAEFGGGLGETTNVLIEGDVATPEVHNALVAATDNLQDTTDVLMFGERASVQSPLSVLGRLVTPPEQGGLPDVYAAQFAAEAAAAGLQADLSVAPGTDVVALYEAASAQQPEAMRRVITVDASGDYRYVNVGVSTQAGESGSSALADNLADDFVPVSSLAGVTAVPTNENIISRGVVEALQASQVSSLGITLLAAMALLVLTFFIESRRPFLGVITIAPVALVVLWVFGMMALTGISFNPVTAMIAAIAIGIGVPYTIHITHRYQEDRIRFDTPEEAIRSTMTHTGGALAGSAFTTVAGFGILTTSSLKPFQQLGLVTVYAIGLALVAAVLVLPSLLILWDRWHTRRGEAAVDEKAVGEVFEPALSID